MMKKIAIILALFMLLPIALADEGGDNDVSDYNAVIVSNGNDANRLEHGDGNNVEIEIDETADDWRTVDANAVSSHDSEDEDDSQDNNETDNGGRMCAQVITYAVNKNGFCKDFPTPCKVPKEWKIVESCKGRKEKIIEKIKEIKDVKERLVNRDKEFAKRMREKIKETVQEIKEDFKERVYDFSVGEEIEIIRGLFVKLESVQVGASEKESLAAITATVPSKNFEEEIILKGNERKFMGGFAIKLLKADENSAKIQILLARGLMAKVIGSGNLSIMPNIEKIAEELDNDENGNLLDDLNAISREKIKKLIMSRGNAIIRAEVEAKTGKILKEIRKEIMNSIKARIKTSRGEKDLNISQNSSGQWVINTGTTQTPIDAEIEVDENNLYISTPKMKKRFVVLPEEASDVAKLKANMFLVKAVRLETGGDIPIYKIKGMQRGKILGLFDAEMEVDSDMDIENGNITATKKPWWAFIVFQ